MTYPDAVFRIIKDNGCPLYEVEDIFRLVGRALFIENSQTTFITTAVIKIPPGKKPCRTLIGDITSILIEHGGMDEIPGLVKMCSGCDEGTVRIHYENPKEIETRESVKGKSEQDASDDEEYIAAISRILRNFSMFQSLSEREIRRLVPLLRIVRYNKGEYVIKKGDPGKNLFIVLSGEVEVIGERSIHITTLGKGEVFGEMSLLSGNPVGASIRAVSSCRMIYIKGKSFRRVLDQFPSLQLFFTRLLAGRLAKTNVEMSQELASGMVGKLSDMAPSELFQTLNVNQKSGVLSLKLPDGVGALFFSEGKIVQAGYGKKRGKEAFFELLKQTEGRFKFVQGIEDKYRNLPAIGDFMWLLMQGLNRMDEEGE